jgi:hypothetical protein
MSCEVPKAFGIAIAFIPMQRVFFSQTRKCLVRHAPGKAIMAEEV